jgi:hypothetical protein
MSGSNSSAPEGLAAESLHLTVHSMPAPDLNQRRTRSGRLKMLLVLAVCAAPVVASYLTYFVIRPQARTNYGTLILPTRPLPAEGWQHLDGSALPAEALKGQWLLVTVSGAQCDAACDKRLFMQRQLREMLGRDRDRLDKVWIVTGEGDPPPALRAAAESVAGMQIVRAGRETVARWLQPEPGHALEDHLYVVDPLGEWMMRMPADADPAKVKRDLERLLRASAGWDKAGR